jgi:intraflagellar transport protein 122
MDQAQMLQKVDNPASTLTPGNRQSLDRFSQLYSTAELYFAYTTIHNIITTPFRDESARVVFNTARFLFMRLGNTKAPPGVSLSNVVFVLAQEAERQEAWKLARFAYLKLQTLRVRTLQYLEHVSLQLTTDFMSGCLTFALLC